MGWDGILDTITTTIEGTSVWEDVHPTLTVSGDSVNVMVEWSDLMVDVSILKETPGLQILTHSSNAPMVQALVLPWT